MSAASIAPREIVLGLGLIAFAAIGFPATGWNWIGWIDVLPLLTAVASTWPLYTVLRISTAAPSTKTRAPQ